MSFLKTLAVLLLLSFVTHLVPFGDIMVFIFIIYCIHKAVNK